MEFGRYYEQLEVGTVYQHWPGRTISEYDNTLFALLSMNQNPLFIDAEYARSQPFGRRPVLDTLVFSLTVGMSVADTTGKARCSQGIPCMPSPRFSRNMNRPVSPIVASSLSKPAPTTRIGNEFSFCAAST